MTTRLLFFTDLHMSGKAPVRRLDDYPNTILAKLEEVYAIAAREKVHAVLFGGDLFDIHRCYAYDVLSSMLEIILKSKVKTYMIIGQHDLVGYNKTSYKYSTAAFLARLSQGKLVMMTDPIDIRDCRIYPSHVFDDVTVSLASVPVVPDKCNVVMAHALMTKEKAIFDSVVTSTLPKNNADLLLCGDYHAGMPEHVVNGTLYYSPGSLVRLSIASSDYDRTVKCAVLTINQRPLDLFNDAKVDIDITEIPLVSAKPASEVFDSTTGDKEEKTTACADKFVQELQELEANATDIYHFLEMAAKVEGLDPKIVDYILSFKGKKEQVEK